MRVRSPRQQSRSGAVGVFPAVATTRRCGGDVFTRSVLVATSRTARDINRRVILSLIRKHQPISRADLARRSQLQRSTVSLITEQLIAERLVSEGAQGNLPRGRKPTFLHLNSAKVAIFGVEIKPDETTLVVADLGLNIVQRETIPTNQNARQFVVELNQRIGALQSASPELTFAGIGVALPGRVDPLSGRVVFAPALPWKSFELKAALEEVTGLPVEIENSANACVLTELWSGRYLENWQNLIAVVVADGVEVGLMLNGQIVRGAGGLAGEFGHVVVQDQGPACLCGNRGCLAVCASNLAAVQYYKQAASKDDSSVEVCFSDLLRRAEKKEPRAIQALHRMAHHLGLGIAMLAMGLSPDLILIEGELARSWAHIGPVIDRVLAQRLPATFRTHILPVAPESQSTLRGALVLVLQQRFGGPKIL